VQPTPYLSKAFCRKKPDGAEIPAILPVDAQITSTAFYICSTAGPSAPSLLW